MGFPPVTINTESPFPHTSIKSAPICFKNWYWHSVDFILVIIMQSFHFKGTRKSWAISCLKMESTKCFKINSSLLPGKLRMKTWVKVGLTCSIEIIYGVLIPECDKARKVSPGGGMCRKVCLIHADSSSRSDNQSRGESGSGGRCWLSAWCRPDIKITGHRL